MFRGTIQRAGQISEAVWKKGGSLDDISKGSGKCSPSRGLGGDRNGNENDHRALLVGPAR